MAVTHNRIFTHLDETPQCDGQIDRCPLASTVVCIASNADAL